MSILDKSHFLCSPNKMLINFIENPQKKLKLSFENGPEVRI